jgi:incFII family plasmid replication initiator RepA
MPPLLRRRAIDALLQGLCFHYDPLANRAQRSITNLAIECGLATESKSGNLSITRATRALKFMAELGLITYQTEYDPQIGCNIRPISPSRRHCSPRSMSLTWLLWPPPQPREWENQQRKKQNLKPLEMDELIAKAWLFARTVPQLPVRA